MSHPPNDSLHLTCSEVACCALLARADISTDGEWSIQPRLVSIGAQPSKKMALVRILEPDRLGDVELRKLTMVIVAPENAPDSPPALLPQLGCLRRRAMLRQVEYFLSGTWQPGWVVPSWELTLTNGEICCSAP